MRKIIACIIIPLIVGILCASQSPAQNAGVDRPDVPRIISYQGVLSSMTGEALPSGEYRIGVTLYADEEGRKPVWSGTYSAVIRDGLFDLQLGSGEFPFPSVGEMDRALWLGLRIGDGPEMMPRTPLTAAPYALTVPDRSITAEKLGTDYVSSISVNGEKVTMRGSAFNITGGEGIDLQYDPVTEGLKIGLHDDIRVERRDAEKGAATQTANGSPVVPWSESGNTGTTPGPNYLGTSDNAAFEIHVHDSGTLTQGRGRVMLFEPGARSANIIGGFNGNLPGTGSGIEGATIGGGGENNSLNDVRDDFGTIGGGAANVAGGAGTETDDDPYPTVAGGEGNEARGAHSTVGGGESNVAMVGHGTVSGGQSNQAQATHATVSGGQSNQAQAAHSTVGGGESNFATAAHTTVSGGQSNRATAAHSTVGGGQSNQAQSTHSFVSGGNSNLAQAGFSGVGGGQSNNATDNFGFVGGGTSNQAGNGGPMQLDAQWATVGGGQFNLAQANNATIGGGEANNVTDDWGTIGGGDSNLAGNAIGALNDAAYATVGGGRINVASGSESTVGGGHDNIADGLRSTVAGGYLNNVFADRGTIAGGEGNVVGLAPLPPTFVRTPTVAQFGTIGGGSGNMTLGDYSTIGGGQANGIGANYGTVGGGLNNGVSAVYTTIGGGRTNAVYDEYGTIGGGYSNIAGSGDATTTNAAFATVGGGELNESSDDYATVGGGYENDASGTFSTIGGGYDNAASGDASTVAGGRNNQAIVVGGTVGGGELNLVNDDYSTVGGGLLNLAGTAVGGSLDQTFSTVSGGEENWANGAGSAIPGGRFLKVGDYSFGFNGDAAATSTAARTDVSGSSGTAYFGEVNLWIGNVNGTPKELRLYEGNTSLTYASTTNYAGFKAGATGSMTTNTIYTMPTAFPTINGSFLVSGTTGTLSWQSSIPVLNGGTGGSATPTQGGIAYGTGTAYAFTGAGTAGHVLTSNGTSPPTWQPANASGWNLIGNAGTNPGIGGGLHFLGTTDFKHLIIATNNAERIRVANTGAVSVSNTLTVSNALTVSSGGAAVTGNSSVAGNLAVTGVSSVNGSLSLATSTPISLNGNTGTSGHVLTSQGGSATPQWTDINSLFTGGWGTSGNAATAGQFIGTTNNINFVVRTNNVQRMLIDTDGDVGIALPTTGAGTTAEVSMDINGGLAIRASAFELVTASRTITVGDRSYIRIGSNGAPGSSRVVSLSPGLQAGQILVIECIGDCDNPYTGTQGFRMVSTDNIKLTGNNSKDFTRWDNITLIWDPDSPNNSGTGDWVEIGFRAH